MSQFSRYQAQADAVAENAHNMHDTTTGGGGSVILEDGFYYGYLCQYVEYGNREDVFQGKSSGVFPHFQLGVALFYDDDNPETYTVNRGFVTALKTSEKSGAVRIFRGLNITNDDAYTHIAQFLGEPRSFKVIKKETKTKGQFRNEIDWSATGPATEGRPAKPIALPDISDEDIRVFFWDSPTQEDWDKLYVEPRAAEGDKRALTNFIQNDIVNALNFEGSALQEMLEGTDFDFAAAAEGQPKASTKVKEDANLAAPDLDDGDEAEGEPEAAETTKPKAPAKPAAPRRPARRPARPVEPTEEDADDDIPY